MSKSSQFKPGQSGNPKGRPKSHITTSELRAKLAKDADQIIESVVQSALQGDTQAARLVLERIIPAIKPTEQAMPIDIPTDTNLTEQGRAILGAVAAGDLAPSQGAALVGAIGTLARVVEIDELAARVAALEDANVRKA
jgi:hypothetical protein